VWTIEVNPHYPSSAEVVEYGYGTSVLATRPKEACSSTLQSAFLESAGECFGNAILFARESVVIASRLNLSVNDQHGFSTWPALADIQRAGTHIERGHPIVTIFARGRTVDEVAACLKARVAIVENQLYA
jgi:predicted ATP-grasp superfamily ATP-dependent carboligase